MELVSKFQGQTVLHPSTITQHAAIAALTGPEDFLPPMIGAFDRRRNYIMGRLQNMGSVACARPGGAFYVFPDLSAYTGRRRPDGSPIEGSLDLAMYLLEAYQVISAPGAAFGSEGCLRFSYATTLDVIEKGMDRVEEGLSSLAG